MRLPLQKLAQAAGSEIQVAEQKSNQKGQKKPRNPSVSHLQMSPLTFGHGPSEACFPQAAAVQK